MKPHSHQCADQAYLSRFYERAYELYSEAVRTVHEQDTETKAALLANRAAALTNLKRNEDAVRDCEQVRCSLLCPPGSQAQAASRASKVAPRTCVRLEEFTFFLRPRFFRDVHVHYCQNNNWAPFSAETLVCTCALLSVRGMFSRCLYRNGFVSSDGRLLKLSRPQ